MDYKIKISVYSSNQPRHLALVQKLSRFAAEINFVCEATTVFPGQTKDFFSNSPVMKKYFQNVQMAERKLFGSSSFTPPGVRTLVLKTGDISGLGKDVLASCLDADYHVVFGASYIRGWLADELAARKATNIHMGLSPFYRGSSCNFWAMYDDKPGYVGATIHRLSKGLDNGPIIRHVRPVFVGQEPFLFTMSAVEAAQDALLELITTGELLSRTPIPQDRIQEIRYTRNADFSDDVAQEYLSRNISSVRMRRLMELDDPESQLV